MNIQPIEKREQRTDGLLAVHSIFHTIQGEGPFCGVPCVFVRLAGCNLQCPACDTDYTSTRRIMSPWSIVEEVFDTDTTAHKIGGPTGLVVITGGEPFRQQIGELLRLLVNAKYYVQIETNGTLPATSGMAYNLDPLDREGVYVVCSPKTGRIHDSIYDVACALKYVVKAGNVHHDGLPLSALEHPSNPYPARPPQDWERAVYVQPMDSKDMLENDANTREAVASCLRHGYTLQLQIHKHIGVE